jgi:hypothetical protein
MKILVIMLAGFFFGEAFPTWARPVIEKVKTRFGWRRLKPFDCEACLSFWFTLVVGIFGLGYFWAPLVAWVVFKLTAAYQFKKITGK